MTQEALKLALESLKDYSWHGEACPQHPTFSEPERYPQCTCGYDKVITAIEEALAQPEQETVIDKSAAKRIATTLGWTPPRTWVGLTDEEIDSINYTSAYMLAREVEAKLKERNQ